MAGFVGILHLDGAPATLEDATTADRMGAAIRHRGLTERSILRDGPLVLVGPGPLPSRVVVDARSPGADVGPFARAAWDGRTLTLARDRAGAAPLFTARAGALLLFGSELKALLTHPACPREVDWVGALSAEAMPLRRRRADTWFLGIEQVEPGSTVHFGPDGTHGVRHAPVVSADDDDNRSDEALIEGYRDVFVRAVEDALGAGDSGLLLSGGIDSVSIAAIAARHAPVPTFTVLGQSTFGNGDAGLAHRAATELGLPFHPVLFRWREPITSEDWRRLLWLVETPFCAAQHYYKLHLHRYAAHAIPDLRTMLTGEGSDEYSGADFANHGEDREEAGWEDYLEHLAGRLRDDLLDIDTLAVEHHMGRSVFRREVLERASGRAAPAHPWLGRLAGVHAGLANDVLWRDDRLAAGVGMRSEAPFTDQRVVDYVAALPRRTDTGDTDTGDTDTGDTDTGGDSDTGADSGGGDKSDPGCGCASDPEHPGLAAAGLLLMGVLARRSSTRRSRARP